jgi:ankyrin repeat protein
VCFSSHTASFHVKIINNKKIEEEIQEFLGNVQAGKNATSVLMNVVGFKPQFVHQTFAEYFTARWFSRNFQLNRSVLEHILFESNINGLESLPALKISHSFVRNIFNKILARSSPLHSAVLDCDEERVVTLLQEGYDANSVDLGGRTPLHLIAAHEPQRHEEICENITKTLLKYEASVNQKDNVLKWTPLHYAIKTQSWSVVELLLEHKPDESVLELIKERRDDQDYIDHIAKIADKCGHSSLLQFLGSIGVNQGSILVHAAVHKEQLRPVKRPINNSVDCKILDRDGQTPLSYAVTRDRLDVLRASTVERDASRDVCDEKGERP